MADLDRRREERSEEKEIYDEVIEEIGFGLFGNDRKEEVFRWVDGGFRKMRALLNHHKHMIRG